MDTQADDDGERDDDNELIPEPLTRADPETEALPEVLADTLLDPEPDGVDRADFDAETEPDDVVVDVPDGEIADGNAVGVYAIDSGLCDADPEMDNV